MLTDKQHDRLQAAVRDHLARRFAEAAAVYEQLRTEAPDDFQVNHLLGVVRHQQGRAAEACRSSTGPAAACPGRPRP